MAGLQKEIFIFLYNSVDFSTVLWYNLSRMKHATNNMTTRDEEGAMKKEKLEDGSLRYTIAGATYTVSPRDIKAAGGEAAVDRAMAYEPDPHHHPAQYAHLYDADYGEEE